MVLHREPPCSNLKEYFLLSLCLMRFPLTIPSLTQNSHILAFLGEILAADGSSNGHDHKHEARTVISAERRIPSRSFTALFRKHLLNTSLCFAGLLII